MTDKERISRHRATIKRISEDILWIEDVQFEVAGKSSSELVQEQRKIIDMYEKFIIRLEERGD